MNLAEIKIDNEMYTAVATRVNFPSLKSNNDKFDDTAGHLVVEYKIKIDFTKQTVKQIN